LVQKANTVLGWRVVPDWLAHEDPHTKLPLGFGCCFNQHMRGEVEQRRYTAFISYAHSDNREQGRRWAEWIHQALETYRVPKDLIGRSGLHGQPIPRSLFPVFRDEEELAAADNLPRRIERALANSSSLVVICSPRAAQSHWVTRELTYYQELGKGDRIFAVIVDGEPGAAKSYKECFPQPLRVTQDGQRHAEVMAADLRPEGAATQGYTNASVWRQMLEESSDRRLSRRELRERERRYAEQLDLARHKLLAGIIGVELDQLRRRAAAARARRARIIGTVAGVIAVVTATLALFAWLESRRAENALVHAERERDHANKETKRADEARHEAENLIGWVQKDVRGSLLAAGRADVLSELNARIEGYFRAHPPASSDIAGLTTRANELSRKVSDAMAMRDYATASAMASDELGLREKILDLKPDDEVAASSLINCLSSQGSAAMANGDAVQAITSFRAALAAIDRHRRPLDQVRHLERPMILFSLSQALETSGRATEAAEAQRQADEEQEKMFTSLTTSFSGRDSIDSESAPEQVKDVLQKLPDLVNLLRRLQQAIVLNDTSAEQLRPLMNDVLDMMETLLTAQERNGVTNPDDAAALQSLMMNLGGLTEKLAHKRLREEALRWDHLQLRVSRPLVHANPHDANAVLGHADLVLRHVGLLCANEIPAPAKPLISVELSADNQKTAALLVAEARQWLQRLPAQERQKPEWRERAEQMDAWEHVLISVNAEEGRR